MQGNAQPRDDVMVGDSLPMRELRELIAIAGSMPLSVMVQGETGSGKELVARAVHKASGRRGAFVPINMCALSESMLEDSLFGHVRGAFTGAVANRAGLLAEAHGGTLFLDEISGLPLSGQAKLLRAIETQEYRPVGAGADRRSDFRVIAASNEDIETLVARGHFRADLAFRLRGVEIRVPALRNRREDIAAIARHFAALSRPHALLPVHLSAEVIRALEHYDWPGNVRELRQVIARSVAFAQGTRVELVHLERARLGNHSRALPGVIDGAPPDHRGFLRRRMVDLLERHSWNTITAAVELKVTRKTVYARLQRLAIAIPDRYRRRVDGRVGDRGLTDEVNRNRPQFPEGRNAHDESEETTRPSHRDRGESVNIHR